jgi:ABC-type taurine transport system ATPase subunit
LPNVGSATLRMRRSAGHEPKAAGPDIVAPAAGGHEAVGSDVRDSDAPGVSPDEPGPILALRNVSFSYPVRKGTLEAVAPVDLTIRKGDFVCIVGPSGCGKTTLLRLMAGFLLPTTGTITDAGEQVRAPDSRRGMMFQQSHLYPWLTVQQNVEFGPRVRGIHRNRRREIARRYLELVKLQDFAASRVWELSGGMQQRVALARVLANEPHILLMDEPFGALDALTREHMQDELLAIWRSTHTTVVLVTHSVEEAVYLGTRVLVSSDRPARIVADLPLPFSGCAETHGEPRSVKTLPDFIELREKVMRYIWT